MDGEILRKRLGATRSRLKKAKADSLLLTKPANVTYVTGFTGTDSWALITPRAVYLLTDSRYSEQAHHQCPHCRIIERPGPLTARAATVLKKLSVETLAVEKSVSLADFKALKKHATVRLKTAADIVEPLRTIKDTNEIAAIKKAGRIASDALRQTRRYLKPGITENQLAGRLDFQIRNLGATNSFETIIAFGANASRPHHQPGNRKLKKNDTALIDFGVKFKGYCCDLTRCSAVGKPTAFYKKVYNAVHQARTAAIKKVKAGAEISEVDAAARKVIKSYDLPVYGHGTGHGLGLEIHEEPVISAKTKGKLAAGMVFTIEPAVYIPGKIGVRIEDDVLVTTTGCKVLTRNCPHLSLPLT